MTIQQMLNNGITVSTIVDRLNRDFIGEPIYDEDKQPTGQYKPFIEWSEDAPFVDGMLNTTYYSRQISKIVSDNPSGIDAYITNVLIRNRYEFNKLYDTTKQVYNMLDNVDEYRKETNYKGKVTNKMSGGDYTERNNDGSFTDTSTNNNTVNSTMTDGGYTDNTNYGSRKVVNTKSTVPFDSSTEYESGKEDVSENSRNDSVTHTQIADSTTNQTQNGGYNLTHTQTEDTVKFHTRVSDDVQTSEMSKDDLDEYIVKRHGNIGVTTSAQLLEQERSLARFSLISTICDRIIREICTRFYEFEEE